MDAFSDIKMNSFATQIKEISAEGIKNLQLMTFSGDIELIGTEENIIKIEIFASVRSWMSLFFNSERLDSIDSGINNLSIETIGETLNIISKPNYFHPYNWLIFRKHLSEFRCRNTSWQILKLTAEIST